MSSSSEFLKIAGAIMLPNLGGFVNGQITRKHIDNWYRHLNFPSYRPPNWIFAPMWTSLYSGMGYASYLVWRDGGGFGGDAQLPLIAYGTQLALNWAWTPIFFGKQKMLAGLVDLLALTATSSLCGVLFFKINRVAGYIFIPYVAWLSFASLLNYSVYKLNCGDKDKKEIEAATLKKE
ncbi:translocator protein [Eupeodes corollae]|uniref:translocator protein n=1 Tax=Eupeodes corollae TaxID=290404 RepID=UPI0024919D2B|nr:translocator protein [Eupeodes corollae]XP_055911876.1 translocator protein [Eupeodes corollae]